MKLWLFKTFSMCLVCGVFIQFQLCKISTDQYHKNTFRAISQSWVDSTVPNLGVYSHVIGAPQILLDLQYFYFISKTEFECLKGD